MAASLRLRLAGVVAAVSLLVLAGAAMVLVWVVTDRMHDGVRGEAVRAVERSRLELASGRVDRAVHGGIGEPTVEISLDGESSADIGQMDDMFEGLAPDEVRVARRDYAGSPAYVAATIVDDGDGRRISIAAAAPLAQTERTLSVLRTSAVVAVPTLAVLLGALAAVVAGRALRPVAVMRSEADAISHGTLHRRLTPVPRTRELAGLAATMNDMLDRLDRSAIGQRQFVSDVSHELRSPLATIRATIEMALADPSTLAGNGQDALAEVDRLDGLVRDLLALSRLDESAQGATTDTEVDLDDVVLDRAATMRRAGIRVDTSGVTAVRVRGDRPALDGMVRNLLDNAARHAASAVAVGLLTRGGEAELVVDDDGPGVPEAERARIFDRFARLDEGRARDAGGAGLGLAIVAAAAHAHRGTVSVADAPIGGARFRVVLPAVV